MARYDNRQMLHGAVGPMVYYEFMGRQCVRARVTGRNPRTPAQQCGRRVFGLLAHLAGLLRYALRTGLEGEAAVRRTRAQNLFVGMNRPLTEADGDNITLDYSRLQLSAGPLAVPQFGAVQRTEESGGGVRLSVEVSPAAEGVNGLFVHLCAFAPALEQAVVSLPFTLSGGVAELLLPASMADAEVYLYAFARTYNGDASPTVCISVDVEAQESPDTQEEPDNTIQPTTFISTRMPRNGHEFSEIICSSPGRGASG